MLTQLQRGDLVTLWSPEGLSVNLMVGACSRNRRMVVLRHETPGCQCALVMLRDDECGSWMAKDGTPVRLTARHV
jgi:hypothetical protein